MVLQGREKKLMTSLFNSILYRRVTNTARRHRLCYAERRAGKN